MDGWMDGWTYGRKKARRRKYSSKEKQSKRQGNASKALPEGFGISQAGPTKVPFARSSVEMRATCPAVSDLRHDSLLYSSDSFSVLTPFTLRDIRAFGTATGET